MTPKEFKEKYPQYKDLEGDALWDKMEDVLLGLGNVLTADPNREVVYHEPFNINVLQDNGEYATFAVYEEDSFKTVWLDKDGNKVNYVMGCDPYDKEHPTESYRMVIWDANKQDYESNN